MAQAPTDSSAARSNRLQREMASMADDKSVDLITGVKLVRKPSDSSTSNSRRSSTPFQEKTAEGKYNILSNSDSAAPKAIRESPSAGSLRKEQEAAGKGVNPFGNPSTDPLSPRHSVEKIKYDINVPCGVVKPVTPVNPVTGEPLPPQRQNSNSKSAGKFRQEQAEAHKNVDPILGVPKEKPKSSKKGSFRREQAEIGQNVDPIRGEPKP